MSKVLDLWREVFDLADDPAPTGKISKDTDSGAYACDLYVTFDGIRYLLTLRRLNDDS